MVLLYDESRVRELNQRPRRAPPVNAIVSAGELLAALYLRELAELARSNLHPTAPRGDLLRLSAKSRGQPVEPARAGPMHDNGLPAVLARKNGEEAKPCAGEKIALPKRVG